MDDFIYVTILALGVMSATLSILTVKRKRELRKRLQQREKKTLNQFIDENYSEPMEREIAEKLLNMLERVVGVELAGINKDDVLLTDLRMGQMGAEDKLMFVTSLEAEFDIVLPTSDNLTKLRVGELIALVVSGVRAGQALGSIDPSKSAEERELARALLRQNELDRASSLLEELCRADPGDHEAWLMRADIALRWGQGMDAVVYCQRAIKAAPRFARARVMLGDGYRQSGRLVEAKAAYRDALEIRPGYVVAHEGLVATLLAEGSYEELVDACRAALAFAPRRAEFHARLAAGLERAARLDASRSAAQKALEYDPQDTLALLTLAKLDKRSGALQEARVRLEVIDCAHLRPMQVSAVKSELGDILDRIGDHSAAFDAFRNGNEAVMRAVGAGNLSGGSILDTVARYRQVFTEEFFSGWDACKPRDEFSAPIFVVGFPRSGTTLMEQIITASGSILPSDEQPIVPRLIAEMPEVLGRRISYPEHLGALSDRDLIALRSHYWKLAEQLVGRTEGKTLLDKLPLNLLEIGFIYRLFPDSRIVVVIRDPRDCCLSCFMRAFVPNQAMISFVTLEQTVTFYAAVMGYWLHVRPFIKAPVHQVRYEDLITSFEQTARPLVEFAGRTWDDSVLRFFEHSRSRGVTTPSYSDVAQPIFDRAVGRWRNYVSQVGPDYAPLQPFLDAFGY